MKPKPSALNLGRSPHKLGYRMPAEWELHEATWLSWPQDRETWPQELEQVEAAYLEIIKHLHEGEQIRILVHGKAEEGRVSKWLREKGIKGNVFFHEIPTDSPWIRDYGPTFISNQMGSQGLVDWQFNAWGRKYDSFGRDDAVPGQIARLLDIQKFRSDLVMEGGAVEVNGRGVCLVTEECLLNPNRNPSLDRTEIEGVLKDFLGLEQVIWLGEGIAGDDTDGHIDELARFVSQGIIAVALEENLDDENFKPLQENWNRLSRALDQNGKPFKLVALPMPEKIEMNGKRFPASYANFYMGNQAVLVPTFRQKSDSKALGILAELFPDRKVVGIDAIPLVYGQGALHCITQQQPLAQ